MRRTPSIEAQPLRRHCESIIDNKVERASREMKAWLQVKRSHKLELRELPPFGVLFAGNAVPSFRRDSDQVSNESLILAQNQRWRRA